MKEGTADGMEWLAWPLERGKLVREKEFMKIFCAVQERGYHGQQT